MTKWWTLPTAQERYAALIASLTDEEKMELKRKAKLRRHFFHIDELAAA